MGESPARRPATDPPAALGRAYLRRAPKVELHVHLEGALAAERLLAILRRHGLHPDLRRVEDLAFLYRHASLEEFLDHFRFAVTCLRDVDDVHDVARDLFAHLAAQHVVYAEVIFSATIFTRIGLPLAELLDAVAGAAAAAEDAAGGGSGADAALAVPRFNLVVDLVRNFGPDAARRHVEDLARLAHPRVVGIHLGGDEAAYPARLFGTAFAAARDAGLGCAAHAGEGAGPESVREALDVLQVTRVGHGVRSIEDPALVAELARRRITLEICPTSNACTGVVPEVARHPLPELLRAGVRATIGADDPSYFGTDLERELVLAHEALGLDLATVDVLMESGLAAAFLPVPERSARLADLGRRQREARAALGLEVAPGR
jgi:adenosine deaminase